MSHNRRAVFTTQFSVKATFESKRTKNGIMKCNDKYFDKIYKHVTQVIYRCHVWEIFRCYLWTLRDIIEPPGGHFMRKSNISWLIEKYKCEQLKYVVCYAWIYQEYPYIYEIQWSYSQPTELTINRKSWNMVNFSGISHVSPAISKYSLWWTNQHHFTNNTSLNKTTMYLTCT